MSMREFSLAIGYGVQNFFYPEEDVIAVLEARKFALPKGETELIREALTNPIDSAPLAELVRPGDRVCLIFSDITRLWVRHHIFIPFILDELAKGGVPNEDIYAVCATGDHREQTEEEFKRLLGDKVYERLKGRIYNHRARHPEEITQVGETTLGTPVQINKRVVQADRVILMGGIVYHFLYGWGGGKKTIMPGVSSRHSIMLNHGLACHPEMGKGLDPAVCAGKMRGNRVNEDAIEVAEFVKPTFLLNTVINAKYNRIGAAVAGNWLTAHEEGARICKEYYGVPIRQLSDLTIVSCGGFPADINFYQTYKVLYNADKATKPGGVIILLSESREGIGNEDFYHMFIRYQNNREREMALRREYTIGGQMAFHAALMAEKFTIFVLSSLPDEQVKQTGMIPVITFQETVDRARQICGQHPATYIMPYGHEVFPYLELPDTKI